jgi:hypothetical protein
VGVGGGVGVGVGVGHAGMVGEGLGGVARSVEIIFLGVGKWPGLFLVR